MDFAATLAGLTRSLDQRETRWALMGAAALGFHGVVRATFDVDLLLEEAHLDRLDAATAELGYVVEHRWEESSHYRSTGGELCPLDVLHARRPHTRAMLDRALRLSVDETLVVPVLRAEDLIGLKVQAMVNDPARRRAELTDILALLELDRGDPRMDRELVREYFALFEEQETLGELLRELNDAHP